MFSLRTPLAGAIAQAQRIQVETKDTGAGHRAAEIETKLATGRYYMARQLPKTATQLARIRLGAAPVMALAAARF
ncbi:acyl-CoA dehydrogenase C-terminal domain-containing protein [Paracoccus sp. APAP_BH8]